MQRYVYKPGSRFPAPAQAVGERIELITARTGHITPADVIEDARDPASPLHRLMEWDDTIAAEKYRVVQAQKIIRSVYPIHLDAEGREKPVLGWINVDVPDEGRVYVTTVRAVLEPELREQVEADALAAFQALRLRYEHITSLSGVFQEIDRALRRAQAQAAPKEQRAAVRA